MPETSPEHPAHNLVRVVPTRHAPSADLLRVCAPFALALEQSRAHPHRGLITRAARAVLYRSKPGTISLITGPSGCGKSTILRAVARLAAQHDTSAHRALTTIPASLADRAVIDVLPGPLASRLGILSRAGLADAALLARTPLELSEGERHRLLLALTLARARRAQLILIDEFTTPLDRATARGVALTLSRWARRTKLKLVIATPHSDLLESLNPDALLEPSLGASRVRLRWRQGDTLGDITLVDP